MPAIDPTQAKTTEKTVSELKKGDRVLAGEKVRTYEGFTSRRGSKLVCLKFTEGPFLWWLFPTDTVRVFAPRKKSNQ